MHLTVSGYYPCPQDAHCLSQYSIKRVSGNENIKRGLDKGEGTGEREVMIFRIKDGPGLSPHRWSWIDGSWVFWVARSGPWAFGDRPVWDVGRWQAKRNILRRCTALETIHLGTDSGSVGAS